MTRVRATLPRALLALGLTSALVAAALGPAGAWLLPAGVAALASPFFEWRAVPPRLARLLTRACVLTIGAAFAVIWFTRPLFGSNPGPLPALLATALVLFACFFALAPGTFPAGRSLAPAIVGLLALGGMDPMPAGFGPSRVAVFHAARHSSFAEVYLGLCIVTVLALWVAAIAPSGPQWSRRRLVALVFSMTLGVALATAGVLGLPAAQPLVERAVAAQLSSAQTGLSEGSTLGEFTSLAASRRRLVDVRSSPPAGRWLLRAEALTRFDGRRWTRTRGARGSPRRRILLRPSPAPGGPQPLLSDLGSWFLTSAVLPTAPAALRLNQHVVESWPLLLPRNVAAVTADIGSLENDDGFYRRPLGVPVRLYGALVTPAASSPDADPRQPPPADSLELPALDPRLRGLASTLAPAAASERDKLAATLRHFQFGYSYTLSPGAWGKEPVAEFVFEKRRGYCEYFASATVVLLRLQGVPARFVKGLRVGPHNDYGGGLHVVRESDAHAWVEAFIPGEGWVEADPTPPGALENAVSPTGVSRLLERLRAALSETWARLTGPGPVALLRWLGRAIAAVFADPRRGPVALLALAALLLGPRLARWLRARPSRRRAPAATSPAPWLPVELAAAMLELERTWQRAGHPRPPARGFREHTLALASSANVSLPRSALEAAGPLVDAYYRARYGGERPPAGEIHRLRAALHS